MCGIAGAVWSDRGNEVSEQAMDRMLAAVRHRGPDAGGQCKLTLPEQRASVRLGHRRLSIIDLSDAGEQPMRAADADVWITFNGEIFNYRELRDRLRDTGHRFRSETDTEVILAAYLEYGRDFVSHLIGQFAFAIADCRPGRQRVLLVRDRIGQKPLFYSHDPTTNRLLFASELKSLVAAGVSREIDPQAVALYLTYQYVPHPKSILAGCAKLPPAHLAEWTADGMSIQPYWQAPFCEPDGSRSTEQWRRDLRETVTDAVRLRMRSDVPIGAFLSGGVDSSITAGLMQSLSDEPIHTFSIGFPIAAYDETRYANEAAALLGTRHHVDRVEPAALRKIRRLVWHYDEPFGDSSALPMTHVSHFAREFVTVSLSGDGGDELFAGYNRYAAASAAARLDRPWTKWLWRLPIWRMIPQSGPQRSLLRRAGRFTEAMAAPPSDRYLRWISHFDPGRLRDLLSPAMRDRLGDFSTASLIRDAYDACGCRDLITQTTCADVRTYLPCDILTKVDIASMSASLEARSPFLDHRVVELAARMPVSEKVRMAGGRLRQKAILIETFADLLPESIQTRPKMGFGIPIDTWFREELNPLLHGVVLSDRAIGRDLFDPDTLRRLVREHETAAADHAYRLWTLLMLELWMRAYHDGDMPSSPDELDLGLPDGAIV